MLHYNFQGMTTDEKIAFLNENVVPTMNVKSGELPDVNLFDYDSSFEGYDTMDIDECEDELISENISNLTSLSQEILDGRSMHMPLQQRSVTWNGIGEDVPLPALPSRKKKITELDWQTFLNFQSPHLWFPLARILKRKIIIHCGPTNSGKTYRAMQRLKQADSGLYCGPLRLLAWEVHDKMCKDNVPCSLLTGQEVIDIPDAKHISSTVEMCNFERIVDVAVIDEIQMIQDVGRGGAWTRALLGLPARELHLCGDDTSLQWILDVTKLTGEEVIVNRYERLSPVSVQENVVPGLKYLKKGDCIVCFSRKDVYWLKQKIEKELNKKVAVIYGTLPPAVRKLQADLFNDPNSDVDILVASDAIGMGLNLQIGRVIFSTMLKFDGKEFRKLLPTEIKQIGGRAGRYNTEFNHGWVSTLYNANDLEYMRTHFMSTLPPMEKAVVLPTSEHLLLFNQRFPHIPFSSYLTNIASRGKFSKQYTLGDLQVMIDVASVIDDIPVDSYSRLMLCYAPFALDRFKSHRTLLTLFAQKLCEEDPITIPSSVYVTKPGVPENSAAVAKLEETFANLDIYVWLAYRFGEHRFPSLADAQKDRALVAELIHHGLRVHTKTSLTISSEMPDGTIREAEVVEGDTLESLQKKRQQQQQQQPQQQKNAAGSGGFEKKITKSRSLNDYISKSGDKNTYGKLIKGKSI